MHQPIVWATPQLIFIQNSLNQLIVLKNNLGLITCMELQFRGYFRFALHRQPLILLNIRNHSNNRGDHLFSSVENLWLDNRRHHEFDFLISHWQIPDWNIHQLHELVLSQKAVPHCEVHGWHDHVLDQFSDWLATGRRNVLVVI